MRRRYGVPHSGGWPRSCPSCGRETVFCRQGCPDCRGVPSGPVTPRMIEALALLGSAASRADAARRMGISVGWLNCLIQTAYRRLGVSTLVGALAALGWLIVPGQYRCHPDPATMDLPRPGRMAGV